MARKKQKVNVVVQSPCGRYASPHKKTQASGKLVNS